MQAGSSVFVGLCGLFLCRVVAQCVKFAAMLNSSAIDVQGIFLSDNLYPFIPGCVVPTNFPVTRIFRFRAFAKIPTLIVQPVAVLVVNQHFRFRNTHYVPVHWYGFVVNPTSRIVAGVFIPLCIPFVLCQFFVVSVGHLRCQSFC